MPCLPNASLYKWSLLFFIPFVLFLWLITEYFIVPVIPTIVIFLSPKSSDRWEGCLVHWRVLNHLGTY